MSVLQITVVGVAAVVMDKEDIEILRNLEITPLHQIRAGASSIINSNNNSNRETKLQLNKLMTKPQWLPFQQ